jgi:GTP:adenosylcobinamide-phosphate guanylyltransferase
MALQVIVTAGGELPKDMRGAGQPSAKALLEVGGQTMLARAIAAARELPGTKDIAVVGDEAIRATLGADVAHVPSGGSVIDNLVRAFEHLGGAGHDYIVMSSDLPFITPAALLHFVDAAAEAEAELALPIVTRESFLARFPDAPNWFEHVENRKLTMGSAFYFTGPLLQSNIPLMHDFARFRKQPHKLAMLLGWEVLWGFITRRISLALLERRASAITGGVVKGIELDDAELAFDIDTKREYLYATAHAKRILEGRPG